MFYLGSIQGGSGAYGNRFTGTSGVAGNIFTIPQGARKIYLQSDASGTQFEISVATGTSFLTTAARGAFLTGPNTINGPFGVMQASTAITVSTYNALGGIVTVRVYCGHV